MTQRYNGIGAYLRIVVSGGCLQRFNGGEHARLSEDLCRACSCEGFPTRKGAD